MQASDSNHVQEVLFITVVFLGRVSYSTCRLPLILSYQCGFFSWPWPKKYVVIIS